MQRGYGIGFRLAVVVSGPMLCSLALLLACTRSDKPTASKASAQQSRSEQGHSEQGRTEQGRTEQGRSEQRDRSIIASARATATASEPGSGPAPIDARASGSTRCVVPAPAEAPPPAARAEQCPTDPEGAPELAWGSVTFSDAPAAPRVRVELAATDAARSRGLMYRTELEADQGMLFSWPDERRRSFWMKNTCIPLDMLFIDREGTIVGILENVPVLNLASRGVHCPATHVLEVNAGFTRQHGVFAGQKVDIEL